MKIEKLGSLTKITSGGTPSRKKSEYYGGKIPWIKTGDLKKRYLDHASEYITQEGLNNYSAKLFPAGTVLVALYGATIGACSILGKEAATNQACGAILPSDKIYSEYLYHYFNYFKPKLISMGVGGAQPNISGQILKDLYIPLPPLEEQRRIAAILDKADAIRRKQQQAIDLCDQFLKALFIDMFGDPVTNPKGWEVKTIEDSLLIPLRAGAYYPKSDYCEGYDGTEMVHMSDAFYSLVKRGKIKRVRCPEADIVKYQLNHNDILVARRSLNFEGAAKPCQIPFSDEPLIYESSLIRVRVNQKLVLPIFFYFYLSCERAREKFLYKNITKSTISGINQKGLNSTEMYFPTLDLQNKFAEIVKKTEAKKAKMQKSLELMNLNFENLSQKAFKAEL